MIYSLKLLNHFLELPKGSGLLGFDTSLLQELLTGQGFEVESLTVRGKGLESVVVGRIVDALPHPNAERLQVCQVEVGQGEPLTIVCGAPNARVGLYVAVALTGTVLPGGMTIRKAQVRGTESHGMLCSREELGLPKHDRWDPDGIWELSHLPQGGADEALLVQGLGRPVFQILGLEDVLMEVGVTPNRADALGHQGLAREIRAGLQWRGLQSEWALPFWDTPLPVEWDEGALWSQISAPGQGSPWGIEVISEVGFPAFFIYLESVGVAPSPPWLRNLLEGLGLSSINSVVDATNFVRVAYGHPSHAYDCDKLQTGGGPIHLQLRCAKEKETFLGLDGKGRELHSQDVVVAQGDTIHGLLGVLGGEVSKVDDGSTRVLLEFAQPSPVAVRRTSRRHGRVTESSFLFEKGIDGASRGFAALQVLKCLVNTSTPFFIRGAFGARLGPETCTQWVSVSQREATFGSALKGTVAVRPPSSYPQPVMPFAQGDLEAALGVELVPWQSQLSILRCLEFGVTLDSSMEKCHVTVPSWRALDVVETVHLVEEVARMVGIDAVPPTPLVLPVEPGQDDPHLPLFESLAQRAVSLGLTEVAGFQFMAADDWAKLGLAHSRALGLPLVLLNPIVAQEPYMQQTLVPDLLRKAVHNCAFGSSRGALFAQGRTFQGNDSLGNPLFLNDTDAPWTCPGLLELFEYHPEYAFSYSTTLMASPGRPTETPRMAFLVFGNRREVSWSQGNAVPWAFQDLLALLRDTLWAALEGPVPFERLPEEHPFCPALHPTQRALLGSPQMPLGWAGALHPRVLRSFGLEGPAFVAEVNLAQVMRFAEGRQRGEGVVGRRAALRKFPIVNRDLAFIVSQDVSAGQLVAQLEVAYGQCPVALLAQLLSVRVFDVYRGPGVETGKKSVGMTFSLGPTERTLLDAEITQVMGAICQAMADAFNAELRSS